MALACRSPPPPDTPTHGPDHLPPPPCVTAVSLTDLLCVERAAGHDCPADVLPAAGLDGGIPLQLQVQLQALSRLEGRQGRGRGKGGAEGLGFKWG